MVFILIFSIQKRNRSKKKKLYKGSSKEYKDYARKYNEKARVHNQLNRQMIQAKPIQESINDLHREITKLKLKKK